MDYENTLIKAAFSLVGTAATYLWGGWDAVLVALATLVVLDYLTGWAAAWVGGRLSSEVGRRGIAKKIGVFVLIAMCNVVDQSGALGAPFLRTLAAWFYIGNEALSITENLAELGVPIPSKVKQAMAALKRTEGGKTP